MYLGALSKFLSGGVSLLKKGFKYAFNGCMTGTQTGLAKCREAIPIVAVCNESATWQRVTEAFQGVNGFLLVGRNATVRDAAHIAGRLVPSALLVEESCPELRSAKELVKSSASAQVSTVVLAGPETSPEVFLRIGCMGVINIHAPVEDYRKAIRAVSEGEIWAPRKTISAMLRKSLLAGGTPTPTRREMEILKLISNGHSNQAIAEQLFISRETVRWHIRGLYAKLGVTNRQDARQLAIARQS